MKVTRIRYAPDIHFQPREPAHDFKCSSFERIGDFRERPAMVRGAQRFGMAVRTGGYDGISRARLGARRNGRSLSRHSPRVRKNTRLKSSHITSSYAVF